MSSAGTGATEGEIRRRFLDIRAKVIMQTATDIEALEAVDLIELMKAFQTTREHTPKPS